MPFSCLLSALLLAVTLLAGCGGGDTPDDAEEPLTQPPPAPVNCATIPRPVACL